MSKKSFALLIAIAILIAVLAGFFTSKHPDGLIKVARTMGFDRKSVSSPAIYVDQQLHAIPGGAVTAAVSGIFGIILILFIFRSISKANYIGDIIKKLLNLR